MASTDTFDTLRELLHEAPSPERFHALITALEEGKSSDYKTFQEVWRPYAREHIRRWAEHTPLHVERGRHWSFTNDTRLVDPLSVTFSGERVTDALEADEFGFGLARTVRFTSPSRWDDHRLKPDHGAKLGTNPALAAIEGLSFSEQRLGPEGAAGLAASPHLGNLKALVIKGNAVRAQGAEAIASASALGRLEILVLTQAHLGGGVEPIFKSRKLKSLHTLVLDENAIGGIHLKALAGAGIAEGLTFLSLNSNKNIGSLGIDHLVKSKHLGALGTLNLRGAKMKVAGAKALAACATLPSLRTLNLRSNDLSAQAAAALAQGPLLTNLTHLDIGGNKLTTKGAVALGSTPDLSRLQALDIGGNSIGDEGIRALAANPTLGGLRALAIGGNGVGPEGLRALLESPAMDGLESLSLNQSALGDAGVMALLAHPGLASLRSLSLYGVGLGDEGARALASCEALSGLEALELGGNWGLSDETSKILRDSQYIGHALPSWF